MITFNGICLITRDTAKLRAFYCSVLQVEVHGDADYAAFAVDGASLSLFAAHRMEEMAPGSMAGAGSG
ncbi:MAG: hypothetical protein JXC32_10010, partial [Anaerolineae bacterium]|nr:hypothetical protein [Anaerolineae bacterium]